MVRTIRGDLCFVGVKSACAAMSLVARLGLQKRSSSTKASFPADGNYAWLNVCALHLSYWKRSQTNKTKMPWAILSLLFFSDWSWNSKRYWILIKSARQNTNNPLFHLHPTNNKYSPEEEQHAVPLLAEEQEELHALGEDHRISFNFILTTVRDCRLLLLLSW